MLAAIIALHPILTASPVDAGSIVGLLVFGAVSFAPLFLVLRRVASDQRAETAPRVAQPG